MNVNELEQERKIYHVLNRKFIILRRRYILGIFPLLLCVIREENDGYVKEQKLDYKIKRHSEYPEYSAMLIIESLKSTYLIDKYAYSALNFRDRPVWFEINNPEPFIGFK